MTSSKVLVRYLAITAVGCLAILVAAVANAAARAPMSASGQSGDSVLVFSGLSTGVDSRIAAAVLREAYRRIGHTIRVERFAGDVALDRANSGAVTGDLQRIDDIIRTYPNLIQVPIPIGWVDVAVYSHDPRLSVKGPNDLRTLRVGVVRGILAVERSIGDLKVRMVDTYAELFALHTRGEVDAMVVSTLTPTLIPGETNDPRPVYQNGILDSYLLYHYLHRDHAALAAELTPVLKAMLLDGSIARIRIAQLRRPQAARAP